MNTKSAFVAIVGRPNVGKSSLLNELLGEKVAIVSDKPQTTRTKIMGVLTNDHIQYVFMDTPGMHRPRTKLSNYMVKQIEDSVADVDITIFVTEAYGPITKVERELIEKLSESKMHTILMVNKIDTLKSKDAMLGKISQLCEICDFEKVIPVSVTKKDGVDIVLASLEEFAVEGPHFFPDDTLTDQPERVIVAEIIREKVLNNMREEIPHGTAVVIDSMKEREDRPIMDIDATIMCERSTHKGMIIGKQGAMLKTIATEARVDCESFLGCKVNLKCWVKVKEDWRNSDYIIKSFGFR